MARRHGSEGSPAPVSADILRHMLQGAQDAIYAVALPEASMLHATPAFPARLGLPPDFLERGFQFGQYLEHVHPDDRERVRGIMERILASRSEADLPENPARYRTGPRQGPWRHIEDHYTVLRGPGGEPTMIVGNSRDATGEVEARRHMEESEARFRLLAEHSRDIFFTMRFPEGVYEYINPRITELCGFTPQEFYDDPGTLLRCVPADWHPTVRGWLEEIAAGQVRPSYEFPVLDRQGNLRWIEERLALVAAPDGRGMLLQGVGHDKTEERAAREALRQSEARFRRIIEAWPDQVVFALNMDTGRYDYVSPGVERLLGHSPEDFYADPGLGREVVAPHWRQQVRAWQEENRAGVIRPGYEYELVRKDGRAIWVHQAGVLLPGEPGRAPVAQYVVRDITEERRASEALRASEERYRQLAESWSGQVVFRINLRTMTHEYVSPSVEQIFGYTPEQFYRGDPRALGAVAPEWREAVAAWTEENLRGHMRPEYEYEVFDARGRRRWVHQRGTLLRGEAGEPLAVQFLMADITERKELEQALEASERKYRTLHESMRDGFAAVDELGRIVEHNSAFREMLGYCEEEIGRLTYRDITPEAWHESEARILQEQVLARGYSDVYEKEYRRRDGTVFPVSLRTYASREGGDGGLRLWAIVRDISEQKRAEEELRRTDALLSAMLRNLPFDFWARDISGRIIMQSDESVRLWGDLRDRGVEDEPVGEQTLERWRSNNRRALAGEIVSEETRFAVRGGEERDFHNIVAPIRDGESVLGLLGVNIDITGRKATEEALRASNERYELLAGNVADVIWTLDPELRWTYLTPSAEALTGQPVAALMELRLQDVFTGPSLLALDEAIRAWRAAPPDGEEADAPRVLEMELLRAGGVPVPLEVLARPLRGADGSITGYCGTARDITRRRADEEAMRLLNARYSLLAANVADVIWTTDENLRWTYLTPSAERLSGHAMERLMAMRFDELFTPRSMQAVAENMAQRQRELAQGLPLVTHTLEMELVRADGGLVPLEVIVQPLFGEDGAPRGYCGTSRDITQRKAAEEALQRSQRRFSELIRNSSDSITILAEDGTQVFVSAAVERMLGFAPAELMGIPVIEAMLHPEDQPAVRRAFQAILDNGEAIVQYRHRHKGGHWVHLEAWGTNQLANPDIRGVVVNVRDITDRKQAEAALQRGELLLRKLLESMHEGVWAMDADRRTTFVNERLCAMLGYSPAELGEMTLLDVLAPEHHQVALARFEERRAGIPGTSDYDIVRKNGTRFPAQVVSSPIIDTEDRFEGLVCGVADLTRRLRLEREVRRNQARLEALYELSRLTGATEAQIAAFTVSQALKLSGSAAGALFFVDAAGRTLEPRAWEGQEAAGQAPRFPVGAETPWGRVAQGGTPLLLNEVRPQDLRLPPGHPPVLRFLGVPALDGGETVAVLGLTNKAEPYDEADVLQISLLVDGMWRIVRARRDELSIRASLREKEALLREVHHRVKNNLQVVASLLDMAGRRLSEPEARQAMAEVQAKVQAMSLIHILLYGAGDGRGIRLGEYVGALFRQLREIYGGGGGAGLALSARLHLGGLMLGLDQAVPLGLALNEALANVFKHAARAGAEQGVEVRAEGEPGGLVALTVRDHGPGLPPGMDPRRSGGLGMRLMQGLVVHQLGGSFSIENAAGGGVLVTLRFRPSGEPGPAARPR